MRIIRSDIYENLKMALSTLRANKLRSFLTVFGVVIGIITVMLISSIISGIDVSVKNEVESFGTRSIYITKFDPGIQMGRRSREERMRKEIGRASCRERGGVGVGAGGRGVEEEAAGVWR